LFNSNTNNELDFARMNWHDYLLIKKDKY